MELREKIARALAAADDKDPDAPAWVSFPSGQTTGVCWRDQYADKADAILALPEIRDGRQAMEAIARQGLGLLDDGSIGREYKARS